MHFNIFCRLSAVSRVYTVMLLDNKPGGGGVGLLPILAHTVRLRPKGLPFLGCRYTDETVGILLVQVYERVGKSVMGSVKGPKGLIHGFYGCIKSRKSSIIVINSYLNDSAFTAVKRVAKF